MTALLPLALLACPAVEEDDETPWFDPAEVGPHAVATEESTFTSPTSGLAMPVQVWYPTPSDSTVTHRYDGLIEGSAVDGGAADCPETRPVVVFSHGNSGIRFQSIFLTEHLASHGFVVVAPDHVDNTFWDYDSDLVPELMFRRPVDIAEAFDWLTGESDLADCVDEAAGYQLSGHSFGGYTTLALAGAVIDVAESAAFCAEIDEWLCEGVARWAEDHPESAAADLSDPRVTAAVPMTPAGYEALLGGLDQVAIPTLVMGAGLDTLTEMDVQVQPLYDGLTVSPRHLGVLPEATHFTYSDACTLAPTYPGCDDPDAMAEAHPLIVEATTAFFRAQLGDERAGEQVPPADPAWEWTAE